MDVSLSMSQKNHAFERFKEDGFAFFKGAIGQDHMARIEEEIESFILAHAKKSENIHDVVMRLNSEDQGKLFMIYQVISKSFAASHLREQCRPYIELLLREDGLLVDLAPGILICMPNDTRITYDWHQEIVYHPQFPNTLHLWLPVFCNATLENGTMSALKGSHKQGALPFHKREKLVKNSTSNLVPQNMNHQLTQFEEVHFCASPGDLVVLDSSVIHRSNTNVSKHTRFVMSFRVSIMPLAPESFDTSVK